MNKSERKIEAYGKPMGWLKSYMNFFAWVMAVLFVYGAVDVILHASNYSTYSILRMIVLGTWSIFAAIVVRDLDMFSLYLNVGLLIAWPISYGVSLFFAFRELGAATGDVISSANDLSGIGIFGSFLAGQISAGAMAGMQIAIIGSLIRLLIITSVCLWFVWCFWKDRVLFQSTTKQLENA